MFTRLRSNLAFGKRLEAMGNAFMGSISAVDRSAIGGVTSGRNFASGFDGGVEIGKMATRAMGGAWKSGAAGAAIGAGAGYVASDDHPLMMTGAGALLGGGAGLAGGVLRNNWSTAKAVAKAARL